MCLTRVEIPREPVVDYKVLEMWLDSLDDGSREYNLTIGSLDFEKITTEMIEKARAKNWNIDFNICLELPENYFD